MEKPGVLVSEYMEADKIVQHLELGDLIEFRRPLHRGAAYMVSFYYKH